MDRLQDEPPSASAILGSKMSTGDEKVHLLKTLYFTGVFHDCSLLLQTLNC